MNSDVAALPEQSLYVLYVYFVLFCFLFPIIRFFPPYEELTAHLFSNLWVHELRT